MSGAPAPARGLWIPAAVQRDLPLLVRNQLAALSPELQQEFVLEFKRSAKSPAIGYIALFILSWHYFYLKKWGMQILFWLTGGGLGVWWLVDAFRMPSLIREYNQDVAIEAMRNLAAVMGESTAPKS